MTKSEFLTPKDLVTRWGEGVTIQTLANWRAKKVGPSFSKFGGIILYPLSAVIEYEEANRQETNIKSEETESET